MEISDLAKILFGALLGFLLTWLQDKLRSLQAKKKAEKLLKIEIPALEKEIVSLLGKTIMPTTELSSLSYIGVNELAFFSNKLAKEVYSLQSNIRRAEISREIASQFLDNQNAGEFRMHSYVFSSCITSAAESIKAIKSELGIN